MYVLIQLSDLVRAIEESSLSPISPAKYWFVPSHYCCYLFLDFKILSEVTKVWELVIHKACHSSTIVVLY